MNNGGCNIRNPRFMKGNRVVSERPKDRQDKNGREFTLRLSGSEKPDLVFDCQGHGWFDNIQEHLLTENVGVSLNWLSCLMMTAKRTM